MKEHPILFSTPMVQAILEGRKTQTRRIVKPQPDDSGLWNHTTLPMSLDSQLEGWWGTVDTNGESKEFKCPYGEPNDVLWVKETFHTWDIGGGAGIYYKADLTVEEAKTLQWKPSIFMPRIACRITLEIAGLRVERLHDISEADAKAEGVKSFIYDGCGVYENYLLGEGTWEMSAASSYCSLWQKINGAESWKANPFVWVLEFKKLMPKEPDAQVSDTTKLL